MAFGLFKKKEKEEKIPTGFKKVRVKDVVRETADAVSIHFDPEDQVHYASGQFFTVSVKVDGKEERRAYSLCSSPFVDEFPAVAVKRVDGGKVSNFLNDNVATGDELLLMDPIGNFITTFSSTNNRQLILFAGGSGITPLISIAKSALDQEPNSKVTLVYANRNTDSIIFKNQIEKLADDSRFKVLHVLEDAPADWSGYTGRINEEVVRSALTDVVNGEVFMCGPGPMMDAVISILQELNFPAEKTHKESFVSEAAEAPVSDEVIAREVTVIYDDEEFKYVVEPNETILEKGLEEDIDLPFSCQSGLCTACRGKCVSGKVKMMEEEGLSEAEIEEGYVLPCVAHPLTDDVIIEIG
jgi:ring-1,2-phenylacetyl-CoA epoxidase subunit PaaE